MPDATLGPSVLKFDVDVTGVPAIMPKIVEAVSFGNVKGCIYWTDKSLIEGFVYIRNDLGDIDGLPKKASGGC